METVFLLPERAAINNEKKNMDGCNLRVESTPSPPLAAAAAELSQFLPNAVSGSLVGRGKALEIESFEMQIEFFPEISPPRIP